MLRESRLQFPGPDPEICEEETERLHDPATGFQSVDP